SPPPVGGCLEAPMSRSRFWLELGLASFGLVLLTSPAAAIRGGESARPGEVALPVRGVFAHGSATRPSARSPAAEWTSFRARYGDWRGDWNEEGAAPHLASGPGIALAGFARDADAADRAVRAFVGANPGVFGRPDLERLASVPAGALWHVR